MSGSLAARYIAGLPYDPSMGVGQYARAPRAPAPSPGVVQGGALRLTDATGQAVRVPDAAATLGMGGADVAAGGGDMLLAAALGLLPYLPDAYNAIDGMVNPPAQQAQGIGQPTGAWPAATPSFDAYRAATPGPLVDPVREGIALAEDMAGAAPTDFYANGGALPEGWRVLDTNPALLEPVGSGAPANAGGASGGAAEGATPGPGGSWNPLEGQGYDFGLTGSLGELPGIGDIATAGADFLGGAAGYYGSQGVVNSRNPNSGYGHQIGSTIGGIIGSFIPVPFLGTAVGSMMGGALGASIGDGMGAPPTIGRNFSSLGTFTGEGGLSWGNSGGDNGASAADADPFANWFSGELSRQAAAQGLGFNPNMAGAQIRVGGYDNFSRSHTSPAGGYFYDITSQGGQFGGSPENYAARPADDWATGAYTPDQARDFATYVLADLTARNVYTPGGAAIGGQGDLAGTLGADYGYYGSAGGDYSRIGYGGGDFNSLLGARQSAIQGYIGQQQQANALQAAIDNTAFGWGADTGQTWGAYDLTRPIFANGGIVNPGEILFPSVASQPAATYTPQVDGGA